MSRIAVAIGAGALACSLVSNSHAVCIDEHGVSGYHIPLEKELRTAHVVAIGTVVSAKGMRAPSANFDGGTLYRFEVEEILLGKRYRAIDLFSQNNSGRFWMDVGHRYLVFVDRARGTFHVSNCGNSGQLPEQAHVVAAVRKATQAEKAHGIRAR